MLSATLLRRTEPWWWPQTTTLCLTLRHLAPPGLWPRQDTGSPAVEVSEFVTLQLDLDKGELVMKVQDIQVSLTVLRTNDKGVPKSVVECSKTLKPHALQFGQVKDVFDQHVQVEARCLCDCFAEEDRRTLELWNCVWPYTGLGMLTPLAANSLG